MQLDTLLVRSSRYRFDVDLKDVDLKLTNGQSAPLGATPINGGVNFSVFSRHASGVDLLFFDREHDGRPTRVISLNPALTAPITTGMFLYRRYNPAKFTLTE